MEKSNFFAKETDAGPEWQKFACFSSVFLKQ